MARDLPNFIKEKYSFETEREHIQNIGDFQRLNDYIANNNNSDMWAWTMQQDEVKQIESITMTHFNAYLFESLKPQFVAYCNNNSNNIVSQYVDTVINKSKDYVSPLEKYEEERKQTQQIMAELIEENKRLSKNQQEREVIKI